MGSVQVHSARLDDFIFHLQLFSELADRLPTQVRMLYICDRMDLEKRESIVA
jgi:hypothetical protein